MTIFQVYFNIESQKEHKGNQTKKSLSYQNFTLIPN